MRVTVSGTSKGAKVSAWVRVPKEPNRLAGRVAVVMELLCEAIGHYGGCALLNRYPFFRLLSDAASDSRFERVEIAEGGTS